MLKLNIELVSQSFPNKKIVFRLNKETKNLVKVDEIDLQELINSSRPTVLESLLSALTAEGKDALAVARQRNIDKIDELSAVQSFVYDFADQRGIDKEMGISEIIKFLESEVSEQTKILKKEKNDEKVSFDTQGEPAQLPSSSTENPQKEFGENV